MIAWLLWCLLFSSKFEGARGPEGTVVHLGHGNLGQALVQANKARQLAKGQPRVEANQPRAVSGFAMAASSLRIGGLSRTVKSAGSPGLSGRPKKGSRRAKEQQQGPRLQSPFRQQKSPGTRAVRRWGQLKTGGLEVTRQKRRACRPSQGRRTSQRQRARREQASSGRLDRSASAECQRQRPTSYELEGAGDPNRDGR